MKRISVSSRAATSRRPTAWRWVFACLTLLTVVCRIDARAAADDKPEPAAGPIGQYFTVTSPIDDRLTAQISNVANDLLQRARRENRTGILILELRPGTSQLHQVQALARMLSSNQFSALKTVAWVPDTVTGPNALVALACKEIVMHPDAELGDLGRGQTVEPEDEQLMLALAQKRINPKVSAALVQAMIDPRQQLWRVRIQTGDDKAPRIETRAASRTEVETLRQTGAIIEQADVIKEAGVIGVFRGGTARDLDILASHVAENRTDVAQIYNLPRESMRERPAVDTDREVRLIRVTGVINTLQESFLVRQIDRAVQAGARTLIFEIDSPGGEMLASLNLAQAIAALEARKIQTVAYVPRQALSGAAIISLGCDDIFMHRDATIGDAGPIEMHLGGQFERAPEKIVSFLRAELKKLAERKGRPVALCEAMADVSLKVFQATHRDTGRVWFMSEAEIQASGGEWIAGPMVREANGELLLTLDGQRAHELQIAERPVADLDDLKVRLGLPPNLRLNPVEQNWVDALVFVLNLPAVIVLLFMLGIGSLYLELHFPTGLFGIVACLCFALFFWSKFLGGTAGWLEVVLFVLGAGCLALEVFVIPGFGVFGLSGILLILSSIVMASQSWGNLEPYADFWQLGYTLSTIFGALFAVIIAGLAMGRFLPRAPMFEGMILNPPGQTSATDEPQLSPELRGGGFADDATGSEWFGRTGTAASLLRPAGKAEIDGRLVDVVSDGPFIPEGTPIEVIQVSGNRIVVRRVG